MIQFFISAVLIGGLAFAGGMLLARGMIRGQDHLSAIGLVLLSLSLIIPLGPRYAMRVRP